VLPTAQTGQARTTFGEMPHSSRAQYQRDLPYRTVNDTDSPLRTNVNNLDSCICDFSLTNRAMSSQCFLKALFWCIPFHMNKHPVCSAGLASTRQCGQWYGGPLGQKVPVTKSRRAIGTVCVNFKFSAKSRIYLSPHPPPHNLYRLPNHQILSILATSYISITLSLRSVK
jgi:hypothetical protein